MEYGVSGMRVVHTWVAINLLRERMGEREENKISTIQTCSPQDTKKYKTSKSTHVQIYLNNLLNYINTEQTQHR